MTQDELIEMARQAGMSLDICHGVLLVHHVPKDGIEAFAKLVAAKEREACAMVCDVLAEDYGKAGLPMTYNGLKASSKEIRARGDNQ